MATYIARLGSDLKSGDVICGVNTALGEAIFVSPMSVIQKGDHWLARFVGAQDDYDQFVPDLEAVYLIQDIKTYSVFVTFGKQGSKQSWEVEVQSGDLVYCRTAVDRIRNMAEIPGSHVLSLRVWDNAANRLMDKPEEE